MAENLDFNLNNLDEDALKLAKIRQSCLMDDAYMKVFFNNNIKCTQLVLRIILDKDDLKAAERCA